MPAGFPTPPPSVGPSPSGNATSPPSPAPSSAIKKSLGDSTSETSIAVFLFAKEKLLFRYPDTDPFVVDVATAGNTGGSSGGAAAADAASKKTSNTNNSTTNENSTNNNNNNNSSSSSTNAGGRGEAANASTSATASRDRHRRNSAVGGGGGGGGEASTRSGRGTLHPDSVAAAPAGATGGANKMKKKSPHVHVTMAADVKDHRGSSPHVALSSGSGAAADSTGGASSSSTTSTSGVAPQRGMRRPMSAYTLVNDNLAVSGAGLSLSGSAHGHRTGSPSSGGGATLENRRGPHVKGSGQGSGGGHGASAGPTTQVQNTSTGSTRRQASASSPNSAGTSTSAAASALRGSKSSNSANNRTAAQQQQQQQQQNTTGAATCVGIATSVLMHLLRGALNGCTTINMVNCTFLVFPLTLAMPASSSAVAAVTPALVAGNAYTASAWDPQRPPPRATTALLVVAMKQPDTDSGAIANFTQCFVNILCREEQRCRYVSNELDRMEALTNHWEVGGAAAVASAAAAVDTQRQQHPSSEPSQRLLTTARHTHSPSPTRKVGRDGGAAETSLIEDNDKDRVRASSEYDYLFAPPRPAVRGGKPANANAPVGPLHNTPSSAHRTSSHSGHAATSATTSAHRDASPIEAANGKSSSNSGISGATNSWLDPDYDAELEDARRDAHSAAQRATGGPLGVPPSTRAASPSSFSGGGQRRRVGPLGSTASSLYQQLAAYVRLASEVQQVAQCIDLWNRTCRTGEGSSGTSYARSGRNALSKRVSRIECRRFFGVDGSVGDAQRVSGMAAAAAGGRARPGALSAPRDPFRRYSNVGSSPQQQQPQPQSWVTATPGEALDTLPDAILVNQMLLLPMGHLTGQERLEQVQTMRSAYSRIHPCSVVTVEESQFTEELQRGYVDMMGRRYAKLIPLSTVYALLLALPSPRRAGSLYRSIELTLLEAVQRRHARAAAAAAAAAATSTTGNNNSTATPTALTGSVNFSGANTRSASSYPAVNYGPGRSSRDAVEEDASSSSAVAAAAATTAAGLDFLAMEIIDFLRVHGAISVASEMWVCFTHGEVTSADYVAATVDRRRRHRLRAERRRQRAVEGVASRHSRRKDHHHHYHQRSYTQAPSLMEAASDGAGPCEEAQERRGATPHHDSSWISSEATTVAMGESHCKTSPLDKAAAPATNTAAGPAEDPLEAVKDLDTVPAALVLHMLERVVDTQLPHQQQQQQCVPTSASVTSFNDLGAGGGSGGHGAGLDGNRYGGTDVETMSNTPSTCNTITNATTGATAAAAAAGAPTSGIGVMARTPRSSETDMSAGRASYHAGRHLDTGSAGHERSVNASQPQQQQQQQSSTHSTSSASSPPLSYATHTQGRGAPSQRGGAGGGGVACSAPSTNILPQPPTAQLSVYCAWGSACPLCEQLASHPQCWTTAANGGYSVGYYVMNATRRTPRTPAIQLDFPSLDASVCICARHARRMRDHVDLSSLMQSSYSISGGSSVVGQRGGGSSGLLHSLQPWFIRPHMFVTPVTAAYGVSPFEIFERMSYHSSRTNAGGGGPQRQQLTAHGSASAAGVPIVVPVHNTSSLVEPERRELLMISRTQASSQEASTAAAAAASRPVAGEEQGHTLLQCGDIPAGAVDYLRRCSEAIRCRLAYSRSQQSLLTRFEQAAEQQQQQQSFPVKGTSFSSFPPGAGVASAAQLERHFYASTSPSAEDTVSEAAATSTVVNKSAAISMSSSAAAVSGAPEGNSGLTAVSPPFTRSIPVATATQSVPMRNAELRASSPLASSTALSKLSSSADVRPRSLRYGRRQLPLHTATSPLTNVNLLFDSATPTVAAAKAADGDEPPVQDCKSAPPAPPQQQGSNSNNTNSIGAATSGFPFAGVSNLLDGERTLPTEVLLQYVLHHLIALSWGRRGVEVDTLVRLLERNLRRLPPLLANLQYVHQLRHAGFTSESAAAFVAALRAPTSAADGNNNTNTTTGGPVASSAVFTAVHTRLAASPFSVSAASAAGGARPSPSNLTDTPEDRSDTSPYSGGSRAATAMPVTESEVQLLQAYEVLDRLSLMEVLSSYATWPVRVVPTRLLLHTVVNEFCDVLYVDSSERGEEADHWDLPVAAQ